jgi:hypothetical protein
MHALRMIALASLLTLLLASTGWAQMPGDVGVFFDTAGTQTAADIPPFTAFEFYVVAFDLGDFQGFELSVVVPPEVIITGGTAYDAPGIICVGDGCGPQNWVVALTICTDGSGVHPLTVESAMLFTSPGNDVPICVGPFDPSSFTPPAPGYATCAAESIPFGVAENGQGHYDDACAILNPTLAIPIGTGQTSWGTVKSTFGR